ncbi:MAG: hypothetical protein QOG72_2241 [Sphingomonadales bacterium]|jgi:hypothetical protein|nr:hypothetical protein [Sphingomonadales bacterium]
MIRRLAAAWLAAAITAAAAAAPAPAGLTGTWDLTWATRHGPERSGWLVMRQEGSRLSAEIHGRGHVRAIGSATGTAFSLRGSRLAVPYTISGRIDGDRMQGSLKVLSVERRFTGSRRR